MSVAWTPRPLPGRAPGKATHNGQPTCPCANWARAIDANFRASMRGEAELDHAQLCDGHGNPTRGLHASEAVKS